ncbi:hypothetical protein GCM10010156_02890 [Planobispora rosea]|uniref:Uncharacterized protein n=2 Tax=Planobispora rosea TaxID=35762 RepID=A0A8J3S209_PLARO|nr:hypothetical protein GCM10010156_02890 [Planobispora rosea]GIH82198.1 hypothetical protein Pro02_06060 [Planobispora rosea]
MPRNRGGPESAGKPFATFLQAPYGTLRVSRGGEIRMKSTIHRHACPRCGTTLDEGPIMYRCANCNRSVYAADVDTEFHRPVPAAA